MNLYKIWQNVNNGYDTYDSIIVAAPNEYEALRIPPDGLDSCYKWCDKRNSWVFCFHDGEERVEEYEAWAPVSKLLIVKIGTACPGITKKEILSSYNVG